MPSTRVRIKIDMNVMLDEKSHRNSNRPSGFFRRGLKKGTGYFSSHSAAGHADATYCRVQTSTPSPLASPLFRTVFAGSDTHEQRIGHEPRARTRLFDSSSWNARHKGLLTYALSALQ